jgi:hypothetical protein
MGLSSPLGQHLLLTDIWDDGMSGSITRHLAFLLPMLVILALSAACFGSGSQQIAFVSEVDGESEIFLLDPETGEITPLTSNNVRDFRRAWRPGD